MEFKYGRKYTHQVRDHSRDLKKIFDLFKFCFHSENSKSQNLNIKLKQRDKIKYNSL